MPLPMVHISVAEILLSAGFAVQNVPQFYLGIISPDAIHMRAGVDVAAKHGTHLIAADKKWSDINENEYVNFMLGFINENRGKTDPSFLWGYGIHILTDMYWVKRVHMKFREDYAADPAPIQEEREAYYNDTDILDHALFRESGGETEAWRALQGAAAQDFLHLLSAAEIHAWHERTLHWFDTGESRHKNPVRYIQKATVTNFIRECAEIILGRVPTTDNARILRQFFAN
ncbi:MAG: hypothetical protein FWB96_13530 [Defluviitaleaceae bacterium]|nr:hypothetical protein [Defluviitaleaceae bacterium]MCL2264342.1 hypothetical protein [Defluviitaleaceae bacterium]